MTNTTYIFVPSNKYSIQLLEKMLIMLIGGYELHCRRLQLIVMSPADGSSQDALHDFEAMSEMVRQYNKLHACLKDFKTVLCRAEIALPIYLKHAVCTSNHISNSFIRSNVQTPNYIESILNLKNHYNIEITSDDKIIFASVLSEDFHECLFLQSILACFAQKKTNPNITIICDLSLIAAKNKISQVIKKSLLDIKEKCNLVVSGLYDTYKLTFLRLQIACSILDSINRYIKGEPLVRGGRKDLCYIQDNLPSNSASVALVRLGLLGKLKKSAVETIANRWVKNIKIKDPWNDVPALSSINYFLPCLNDWINENSNTDFLLEISNDQYKNLTQELNNIDTLPPTSSQEQRRQKLMISILNAIDKVVTTSGINNDILEYKSILDSFFRPQFWNYELGHLHMEISPTCLFEITDLAFSQEFSNDRMALIWRSACLDLWELFSTNDNSIDNNALIVQEKRISEDFNSNEQKLLSLLKTGQLLMDADIYYHITDIEHSLIAYTSPLTGFCISKCSSSPISINHRHYFSKKDNEILELNNRSMEFQQFIYSYVNMRTNMFSSNFREYIDKQIEKNKAIIQSQGVNVIRMFPQLRKHIGIDFGNE